MTEVLKKIERKLIIPLVTRIFFKSALKTKQFIAMNNAKTEVHSLVSHQDLLLYIYSIKSLLLYIKNVSVVVHSDGSLNPRDKKILHKHIKGIRIYDSDQADRIVIPKIKRYPKINKLRKNNPLLKKLIDFYILSKSNKIISLDSDILFLQKPEVIVKWILSDNKIALLSDESPYTSYQDNYLQKAHYRYIKNLNSGLICYYKNMIDLDLAEKFCNLQEFSTDKRPLGIGDQPFLAVVFGEAKNNKAISIKRLDPEEYIHNYTLKSDIAIAKHYWSAKNNLRRFPKYTRDKNKVHKLIKLS